MRRALLGLSLFLGLSLTACHTDLEVRSREGEPCSDGDQCLGNLVCQEGRCVNPMAEDGDDADRDRGEEEAADGDEPADGDTNGDQPVVDGDTNGDPECANPPAAAGQTFCVGDDVCVLMDGSWSFFTCGQVCGANKVPNGCRETTVGSQTMPYCACVKPADGDGSDGDEPIDGDDDLPIDGDETPDGDTEPNPGEAGDPCPYGAVNSDYPPCWEGLQCIGAYVNSGENAITCTDDADCEADFGSMGVCADGYCGLSFCSMECTGNSDCTDMGRGACCTEIQGGSVCFPGDYCILADGGEPGDPCPYGAVNSDWFLCAEGLQCIGAYANSGSSALPCTDDSDCEADFGSKAVCADGYCGVSWCTMECTGDPECADMGSDACCAEVTGGRVCFPGDYCDEPAGSQRGGERGFR